MKMPEPLEYHKKLEAMVGEWEGEETMHPSPWNPDGAKATSRTSARLDLGGFFIVTDYHQQRAGAAAYRGHGLFGWDSEQKRYTMHWFDSIGNVPGAPALGTWEGDTLCFQHEQRMGHVRYTHTFVDRDTYTFKLERSEDGQTWTPLTEGNYKRMK